jgi:acetyltransferase
MSRRATLDVFFCPKSVAVEGATDAPHSLGRSILLNLKGAPFPGAIYPVNPRHEKLLELPCYRTIADIPEAVDLAVIATPARTVPSVVRECAKAGVPGAVIICAGFREVGEAGDALERELLDIAQCGGIRMSARIASG